MIEPLNEKFSADKANENIVPPHVEGIGDTAESIKDAHATGIGSLGRNDEKLDEEDKTGNEEAGIIKD